MLNIPLFFMPFLVLSSNHAPSYIVYGFCFPPPCHSFHYLLTRYRLAAPHSHFPSPFVPLHIFFFLGPLALFQPFHPLRCFAMSLPFLNILPSTVILSGLFLLSSQSYRLSSFSFRGLSRFIPVLSFFSESILPFLFLPIPSVSARFSVWSSTFPCKSSLLMMCFVLPFPSP